MHIFGILRTALAVACAVVATAAVSAPTRAEPPEANPFSQPLTMAIERIIRDYMMQHPEILLDVQSDSELQQLSSGNDEARVQCLLDGQR